MSYSVFLTETLKTMKQRVLNFDGEFVKLLRGNLPRDKQHVLNFDGEFVKLLRGNIPRDKLSSAITWNSIFTCYNNHPNRTCFITSRYQWACVLRKLNKNDVYGLFLQITTTTFFFSFTCLHVIQKRIQNFKFHFMDPKELNAHLQ